MKINAIILLFILILSSSEGFCADEITVPEKQHFNNKIKEIKLTAEEKVWMEKHPSVSLGYQTIFPPFTFMGENNVPDGMAMDYLEIIQKSTGINFQLHQKGSLEKMSSLAAEKQIDGILFHVKTPEREQYLNFTKPYIALNWTVITRNDYPFVGSMEELKGKKVGVIKKSAAWEFMQKQTGIEIIPTDSQKDMWESLSFGKTDAVIQNIATAGYFISKLGITNLKVAYTFTEKWEGGMGIRKDMPELLRITDKAIDLITPEEHAAIRKKWIALRNERGLDWRTVLHWIMSIVAVFSAILITALIWNRRLAGEIAERKKAEVLLKEREEQFRSMFEYHYAVMLLIDPENGKIIRANQAALKYYGYTAEEFETLTIFQVNQLNKEEIASEMAKAETGKRNYFHFPHRLANGEIRDVEVHSAPIPFEGKTLMFSVIHDITERRQMENSLRENDARYRKAQALGHVGNWEYNIQTGLFWGSDEAKRIYGFDLNAGSFTTDEVENCIPERQRVHQALLDLFNITNMGLLEIR